MVGEIGSEAVVVGYNDSEPGLRALVWGAHEAVRRDVPLRIVHALPFNVLRPPHHDRDVELASRHLLHVAGHARQLVHDSVDISSALLDGLPVESLVDESRRCALLVLGRRRHGRFASLVLGSTSIDVTAQAACPVVVVPDHDAPDHDKPRPVVVGVDASEGSQRALRFGFARAEARGAVLTAVHAWRPPDEQGSDAEMPDTHRDRSSLATAAVLSDAVRPWRRRFPEVAVEERLVDGDAAAELAKVSGHTVDIVVVGSRGRTALAGTLLGSVSQALLTRAAGPVVVVP